MMEKSNNQTGGKGEGNTELDSIDTDTQSKVN